MDEKPPQPQPGQMQIKADEKELQGLYSNLMMIHHSVEEFTLSGERWAKIFPASKRSLARSRKPRKPAARRQPSDLCSN